MAKSRTSRNKALEEWKERYESYRQYRGQYLTTMSIVTTAMIVGLGFAMSPATPYLGRAFILGVLVLGLLVLVIAHLIAMKTIRELGRRLQTLESFLNFESFHTTWPLETFLKLSYYAACVGLVATTLALLGVVVGRI